MIFMALDTHKRLTLLHVYANVFNLFTALARLLYNMCSLIGSWDLCCITTIKHFNKTSNEARTFSAYKRPSMYLDLNKV